MTSGADIVCAARSMLDTPWRHQGRLPGQALDCAGLVICVGRGLGLFAPDFDVTGYGRQPNGTLMDICAKHMRLLAAVELGAVVVVATQREPQHLGVIADYRHGGWSIVHAANVGDNPRVIETRFMPGPGMRPQAFFSLLPAQNLDLEA